MIESDLPDSRQRNSSKMFLISLLNFFIPGGNGLAAKFGTYLIDRLTIKWLYAFLIFITFSFSLLVIQSLCHVPAKEILGDSNSIFSLIWRPFYESYKILKSLFNNTQVGINNGITLIIVVLANFFYSFFNDVQPKINFYFLTLVYSNFTTLEYGNFLFQSFSYDAIGILIFSFMLSITMEFKVNPLIINVFLCMVGIFGQICGLLLLASKEESLIRISLFTAITFSWVQIGLRNTITLAKQSSIL